MSPCRLIISISAFFLALSIDGRTQENALKNPVKPAEEPRTAHYYARLTDFAAEKPIKRKETVMLGNSLTENGADWGKRLGRRHIRNRGIIGDDVSGMMFRLEEILKGRPKRLILMAGVNDLSHQLSVDSIVTLVTQLVDTIHKKSPRTRIYLQSLLPINESFKRYKRLEGKTDMIPMINEQLEQLATERKLVFVNLFPHFTEEGTAILRKELTTDGLHLTEEGYAIWSKQLKRQL